MGLPEPEHLQRTHDVTGRMPQLPPPRVQDKRNHLTLVEFQHTLQLSNIPRASWEPASYLYAEWMEERFRYTMSDPVWMRFLQDHAPYLLPDNDDPDEEHLTGVRDWITTLFIAGQSVDGWKGGLVTTAIKGDADPNQPHPAGKVAVENGKAESQGVRRGLFSAIRP